MAERGRPPPAAPAATEGLPRAFLQSLRTLFDILDDRRRGCVHLREIESRWRGADARELPRGVLEGLRREAPASGLLTFERFVAGLRTSLLHPDGERPGAPPPPPRLGPAPADEPHAGPGRKPPPPAAREPSPGAGAGTVGCRAPGAGVGEARRAPRARGERRRHTITNGVDCQLLKQMKELEQEQEVLLQGLEMMARGRDWYQQQLQRVQERQRRLSQRRAGDDLGAEGSPRPLGRLLPKVQEVARCLGELLAAACAGRAGPPCPPRAPSPSSAPSWPQQTILMLKEQNRLLTQEVTDKSERITQLEQEKSALIKQLFEARALSQQDAGPLDSTFI
ncbi:suppressor APC domain-containing protein 2 isoform X2 [Perognathus longimembris pacificus]|uniref:suppressor APC domain-containing protein 2-like isoform X2 n=1 Tax=Perognathus longimembris pacificus TaxID=214514 RepID=UPI0020191A1E|nr:suppressor APC domain-containing protein 2-like isoform X2 [Perognathus longimembris pacificus]XP_048202351.1 suppressor APC domain-containing protein 2 isoform X2 [Perognathus longimembris pacificus]